MSNMKIMAHSHCQSLSYYSVIANTKYDRSVNKYDIESTLQNGFVRYVDEPYLALYRKFGDQDIIVSNLDEQLRRMV